MRRRMRWWIVGFGAPLEALKSRGCVRWWEAGLGELVAARPSAA